MLCEKCHQPVIPYEFVNTMGKRLSILRRHNGYTLKDLSELTQISKSHLSLLENDKRKPSVDNLVVFARLYSVTHDYLIEGP